MRKYKYVLFDLDGTLVHSHTGIFGGIRHALKEMGRKDEPTEETLRKCIGPTLLYTFSHYFGMSERDAAEATRIYRAWYAEIGIWQNESVPGAKECLKTLKEAGYTLALATSKPKAFADKIVARQGFSEYFAAQVGCGLDGSLPTKASVIAEATRLLNAEKEACLMVGDRKHDAEGAKENGVDCALLKVGYADAGELEEAKPSYVFNDFADLAAFLTE